MKKDLNKSKNRWIKNKAKTVFLILLILVVFFVVNFIIKRINIHPIDFTKEKLYTLSEESKNQVKDIEQNVTIYFFGYSDEDYDVILAKQYADVNNKIKIANTTALNRPDLAQKYGASYDSSNKLIAVQSSQRHKVIEPSELYTYDTTALQYINITEQKLTNAILDTTILKKPQVYFLKGHGEYEISENGGYYTLKQAIVNEVNDVYDIDLLSKDLPEDCDTLIIASPTKDFTNIETTKIIDYIKKGGDIIWLNDPIVEAKSYPNIQKILDLYGCKFSNGVLYETNNENMITENAQLIIPIAVYNNNIVKDVYTDMGVLLPVSGKIEIESGDKLEGLNVVAQTFLKTSDKAFYRENYNQENALVTTKQDYDTEGEFPIAAEFTKKINEETSSKLVVYANAVFASDVNLMLNGTQQVQAISLYKNKDIVLNTIAYLTDRGDTIRIRKDTGIVTYTASEKENKIVLTFIFTVPIVIILSGIIIWQIRRRKK